MLQFQRQLETVKMEKLKLETGEFCTFTIVFFSSDVKCYSTLYGWGVKPLHNPFVRVTDSHFFHSLFFSLVNIFLRTRRPQASTGSHRDSSARTISEGGTENECPVFRCVLCSLW